MIFLSPFPLGNNIFHHNNMLRQQSQHLPLEDDLMEDTLAVSYVIYLPVYQSNTVS